MALSIGASAPLHRSPLQQSSSHLVMFTEGLSCVQFFALHADDLAHPLEFRVRLAWDDLTFYILFSTTVPTVRTDYRYFTVLAVIPALNRETLVAFQGITWKKETNIKIDLIAWISKTDTPNYPIVTIQYFCLSPHFFRQAFLTEKRAKCWTNF